MAPERVPNIVVFNLRIESESVIGSLEYIEPESTDQLMRVRWAVDSQPKAFIPIGDGVAFIYSKGLKVDIVPISDDAHPTPLDVPRYQWAEGLGQPGIILMFILILPKGYTIDRPTPKPSGTKLFKERIALYWILKGDDVGRTTVEWDMKGIEQGLETEILRINNAYLTNESVAPAAFSVDDKLEPHSTKTQTIIMGDFKMGDHYEAGQAGAMGPGAHAHDMTFNQIWNQISGEIDLLRLSEELCQLRLAMRKEATEPEDDIAISDVAHAEQAAKSGNGPKALEKLKSAGKWALSVAEKVGTGVAVSAIKSALGI